MNEIIHHKFCSQCNIEKTMSEFYVNKSRKDGHDPYCKDCRKKKSKQWALDNPDRVKEYNRSYYKSNYTKTKSRLPISDDDKKVRNRISVKKHWIKNKYGLTLDQYEIHMSKSICDVCGKKIQGKQKHLDHDHRTGKVRGVLCVNCNLALGHLKDDPTIIKRLLSYLNLM